MGSIIKRCNVKEMQYDKLTIEATNDQYRPVRIGLATNAFHQNFEYKVWQNIEAKDFKEFVVVLNELANYVEEV